MFNNAKGDYEDSLKNADTSQLYVTFQQPKILKTSSKENGKSSGLTHHRINKSPFIYFYFLFLFETDVSITP